MSDEDAEVKNNFANFDWKDARWQVYFRDLFPPPKNSAILTKYKKKWYKNNVDSRLDMDWDPTNYTPSKPKAKCADPSFQDFSRLAPGKAYDRGIVISPADGAFLCISHMVVLVTGFVTHTLFRQHAYMFYLGQVFVCILDISVHFGFKLDRSFISTIFADEAGRLIYMSVGYYALRNIPIISTVSMFLLFSSNLLAIGQLAKTQLPMIPDSIRMRLKRLSETPIKYPIMQMRAMAEIQICFVVTILYIMSFYGINYGKDLSIFVVLLLMHMLFARWKIDPFMQSAFRSVDGTILRFTGNSPATQLYQATKNKIKSSALIDSSSDLSRIKESAFLASNYGQA